MSSSNISCNIFSWDSYYTDVLKALGCSFSSSCQTGKVSAYKNWDHFFINMNYTLPLFSCLCIYTTFSFEYSVFCHDNAYFFAQIFETDTHYTWAVLILYLYKCFYFNFLNLFLDKGGEREGEKHQCVVAS